MVLPAFTDAPAGFRTSSEGAPSLVVIGAFGFPPADDAQALQPPEFRSDDGALLFAVATVVVQDHPVVRLVEFVRPGGV